MGQGRAERSRDQRARTTPAAVTGSRSPSAGCTRWPWGQVSGRLYRGDQLLWGAAEPLRRMLRILLDA